MRNIALKLMYVGTAYHGWQVQKNAISVAETLEKALEDYTMRSAMMGPILPTSAPPPPSPVTASLWP